jgi:prepilin-type N-terminal cleavage/methylation domain-containing protein
VKRAFSMIELVFVIVILGILSVVAMPKFSSVQDDALISSEKATINLVKQRIQQLHGRWLLRREDFNITVFDGSTEDEVELKFSDTGYPLQLDYNKSNKYIAFGLLLEAENVTDWKRESNGSHIIYKGPASTTVTDENSEISFKNYWKYDSSTGRISFQKEN